MHPDGIEQPASPAHPIDRVALLVWIVLGLAGWLVLAAIAFLAYLAVELLL